MSKLNYLKDGKKIKKQSERTMAPIKKKRRSLNNLVEYMGSRGITYPRAFITQILNNTDKENLPRMELAMARKLVRG